MELTIGTKLFDPKNKYILTVTNIFRNDSELPLSFLDVNPKDAYEIEYHNSVTFPHKTFWATENELKASNFRIATEAEVVLYGKR